MAQAGSVSPMEAEPAQGRARVLIAAGAAVALAAIVVVVAVASGGDSDGRSTVAASQRCVEAWNSDPAARAYGRHNFSFHQYEGALVTFLSRTGEEVGEGEGGLCAVIFPSKALDPEPFAAGQALKGKFWFPISGLEGIELSRVAELQVIAAGSPNTTLDVRGELTPL
jgi:hypothetical protein